jgi:hypothetical protein
LFLKHFPALVAAGHVFVAMPPLFRVDVGKQVYYALDEEEKRLLLERIEREKIKGTVHVTRFKGLGEMNPQQLRESTIHPDTRRLVQLTVDDDGETRSLMTCCWRRNAPAIARPGSNPRATSLPSKSDRHRKRTTCGGRPGIQADPCFFPIGSGNFATATLCVPRGEANASKERPCNPKFSRACDGALLALAAAPGRGPNRSRSRIFANIPGPRRGRTVTTGEYLALGGSRIERQGNQPPDLQPRGRQDRQDAALRPGIARHGRDLDRRRHHPPSRAPNATPGRNSCAAPAS